MNYLRLLWLYLRLGALNELEYRANFAIQLVQALIGLGTALAGLAVVFAHTETLAGWRADELLALLGVYFLVGGLIGFVIQPSMQRLMEDVRLGTLDFTLTKPEDAQLLVSARQVQIWRLLDVLLGMGVLLTALLRLRADVGAGHALAFGAALLAGGAIVYSFWLILATTTFWFVRVDNILVIFESMYQAGRWPVGIYPPWLRAALTFLVPVAFAVTVPAEALVGRADAATLAGAGALALALLALSRWFWGFGVRRYAGASA
ncbi:MAG TPA: ABC-2 family transporter protein [Roseiflexaceae bacterium]|nr:ABC-2 family transporter protein [Roseiflexaceae bacterium]